MKSKIELKTKLKNFLSDHFNESRVNFSFAYGSSIFK